ncbi:hypothetical protein K3G39_13955 [Pontibacter sp. HSC-14F20]|uniref:hypothetical protein n=1 Tax=Pontibacter sp. HSC-14F20 TaxID=2864136 RepID=UPI001C72CF39|nr:hypothetical protein [Pontibacter sp. HSC-14F20]MBX0334342.1 hypothetical protein [Pontibacter sp. HSC-14F20]
MKAVLLILLLLMSGCSTTETDTAEEAATGIAPTETETYTSANSKIRFLWREQVYDADLEDSLSTIMIDQALADKLTDAERAAVGYVVTFIGSECDWDGRANEEFSNLKCKTLTALNLGYQCSDQHLGFLQNWFRNDHEVLARLASCPRVPFTASSQQTFDELYLTTQSDTIKVWFRASGVNLPMNAAWEWTEENVFLFQDSAISLLKVDKSEVNRTELKLSGGL